MESARPSDQEGEGVLNKSLLTRPYQPYQALQGLVASASGAEVMHWIPCWPLFCLLIASFFVFLFWLLFFSLPALIFLPKTAPDLPKPSQKESQNRP